MRAPPLKKALGQHHLVAGALCRPVLDFLEPRGERVVEVGPGGGVLTAELLAAGAARVLAWELDLGWAVELRRRLRAAGGTLTTDSAGGPPAAPASQPAIVVGDAMDLPWGRLPAPTLAAGNLPYGIATALLADLLPHHERVPRAAFLVQREVAERLLAAPGATAYGWLSVLVAAYASAVSLGRVRRGSFNPPPKVEGAFIGFELRPPPLPAGEMPAFLDTVRLSFAQRWKTLRNALAAAWGRERAVAVIAAAGLPDAVRAERLGLAELLALHGLARRMAGARALSGEEPA